MYSKRKKVFSNDLLEITDKFLDQIKNIIEKFDEDNIVNQGLFIMATTMFENTIRQIMRIILLSFPEKLKCKSCSVSRQEVCYIADKGIEVVIDKELYALFKDGVKSQLDYLFKILINASKNEIPKKINILIDKCVEISLYRNSIIHNGGKPTKELEMKARIYKAELNRDEYDKSLLKKFLIDYHDIFEFIKCEIRKEYSSISQIEELKDLWNKCFDSPLLKFEDYWEIDIEGDLISDIKYTDYDNLLSSGEKIILSIWKHQYNGLRVVKTEDFFLYSVDYKVICELYKGLNKTQFYYMG
jgi:hypothetical protein